MSLAALRSSPRRSETACCVLLRTFEKFSFVKCEVFLACNVARKVILEEYIKKLFEV